MASAGQSHGQQARRGKQLYVVSFRCSRVDVFYLLENTGLQVREGDIVIVEADRGKDLGKVVNDTITLAEVEAFQKQQKLMNGYAESQGQTPTSPTGGGKEINPKMIYGKASPHDTQCVISIGLILGFPNDLFRGLTAKLMDEAKALELCRTKVKQRKLPMEVIDAEYQW